MAARVRILPPQRKRTNLNTLQKSEEVDVLALATGGACQTKELDKNCIEKCTVAINLDSHSEEWNKLSNNSEDEDFKNIVQNLNSNPMKRDMLQNEELKWYRGDKENNDKRWFNRGWNREETLKNNMERKNEEAKVHPGLNMTDQMKCTKEDTIFNKERQLKEERQLSQDKLMKMERSLKEERLAAKEERLAVKEEELEAKQEKLISREKRDSEMDIQYPPKNGAEHLFEKPKYTRSSLLAVDALHNRSPWINEQNSSKQIKPFQATDNSHDSILDTAGFDSKLVEKINCLDPTKSLIDLAEPKRKANFDWKPKSGLNLHSKIMMENLDGLANMKIKPSNKIMSLLDDEEITPDDLTSLNNRNNQECENKANKSEKEVSKIEYNAIVQSKSFDNNFNSKISTDNDLIDINDTPPKTSSRLARPELMARQMPLTPEEEAEIARNHTPKSSNHSRRGGRGNKADIYQKSTPSSHPRNSYSQQSTQNLLDEPFQKDRYDISTNYKGEENHNDHHHNQSINLDNKLMQMSLKPKIERRRKGWITDESKPVSRKEPTSTKNQVNELMNDISDDYFQTDISFATYPSLKKEVDRMNDDFTQKNLIGDNESVFYQSKNRPIQSDNKEENFGRPPKKSIFLDDENIHRSSNKYNSLKGDENKNRQSFMNPFKEVETTSHSIRRSNQDDKDIYQYPMRQLSKENSGKSYSMRRPFEEGEEGREEDGPYLHTTTRKMQNILKDNKFNRLSMTNSFKENGSTGHSSRHSHYEAESNRRYSVISPFEEVELDTGRLMRRPFEQNDENIHYNSTRSKHIEDDFTRRYSNKSLVQNYRDRHQTSMRGPLKEEISKLYPAKLRSLEEDDDINDEEKEMFNCQSMNLRIQDNKAESISQYPGRRSMKDKDDAYRNLTGYHYKEYDGINHPAIRRPLKEKEVVGFDSIRRPFNNDAHLNRPSNRELIQKDEDDNMSRYPMKESFKELESLNHSMKLPINEDSQHHSMNRPIKKNNSHLRSPLDDLISKDLSGRSLKMNQSKNQYSKGSMCEDDESEDGEVMVAPHKLIEKNFIGRNDTLNHLRKGKYIDSNPIYPSPTSSPPTPLPHPDHDHERILQRRTMHITNNQNDNECDEEEEEEEIYIRPKMTQPSRSRLSADSALAFKQSQVLNSSTSKNSTNYGSTDKSKKKFPIQDPRYSTLPTNDDSNSHSQLSSQQYETLLSKKSILKKYLEEDEQDFDSMKTHQIGTIHTLNFIE